MQQDTATFQASAFEVFRLYPGAIVGGSEQIIADLLPRITSHPEVRRWTFERALEPVSMVALLVDAPEAAMDDVLDACEELLSSQLRDEPALAMPPLVEVPGQAPRPDTPWGVERARMEIPGAPVQVDADLALEHGITLLALRIIGNVRDQGWDRKTLGPTLLARLLDRVPQPGADGAQPYRIMQTLLAEHPRCDAMVRQFRMNAARLRAGELPILLAGDAAAELANELASELDRLKAAMAAHHRAAEPQFAASVWRRLSGRLGFSMVEAGYLACLLAAARETRE